MKLSFIPKAKFLLFLEAPKAGLPLCPTYTEIIHDRMIAVYHGANSQTSGLLRTRALC